MRTVLFYQVCANDFKAKQSTAGRRLCLFCPSNKLTFDILTLKVVSESRVMWATSVPILVFLGLSVLDLGPMYIIHDRQTSDAHHRLMPPPYGGRHNNIQPRETSSPARGSQCTAVL